MKGCLALIVTKIALAFGLYAHRAHLDDSTRRALRRVDVASKAHTRGKERFTSRVLDQICETQSDDRPSEAARQAERVAEKIFGTRLDSSNPMAGRDGLRSVIGGVVDRIDEDTD